MKGNLEMMQSMPKRRVEPLIVSILRVDLTPRDLLGTPGVDSSPTLVHCERFRSFVWMGWKSGGADLALFTLYGDDDNWLGAFSTIVSGSAGSWFRVEIKPPKLYFAYRFIVLSNSVQELRSKLIGYLQEVF